MVLDVVEAANATRGDLHRDRDDRTSTYRMVHADVYAVGGAGGVFPVKADCLNDVLRIPVCDDHGPVNVNPLRGWRAPRIRVRVE